MTNTETTDRIAALRSDAGQSGDPEMALICDQALAGDADAMIKCERIIADAEAMGAGDEHLPVSDAWA